jgi:cytoskeletal protein RodZ
MNEPEHGETATAIGPDRVGDRLRALREAQGLSLAEVGQRTRVPLRHLEAIEATDFAALPSPTYAVGFSRAYARAVGADEVQVAQAVRAELAKVDRPPEYRPYETADPARVPARGLAIVTLGCALAIVILAGLWFGTDLFRGGGGSESAVSPGPSSSVAVPPRAVAPAPSPTPSLAEGQVRLAAGANEVWLRVYDADNKTLYLGTLAPGASFDVPRDARGPKINVGRPDELQITVNGTAIPRLGDGKRPIKDVPVDAASLAARLNGAAATPASNATQSAAPRPVAARPAPAAPVATTGAESIAPTAAGTGNVTE